MLAIKLTFPVGRYHATPWGRHVNEADVEWPPSPWRLIRSLIATWHRKGDKAQFTETLLARLVERLAEQPPVYSLPEAVRSHSRHYMPVREGKKDKPVLIFDAFVRLDPDAELIVAWPDLELEAQERELLEHLLPRLGFLGRAESWVEASLTPDWSGDINCRPSELSVDMESGEALEPVRLIAPTSASDYQAWRPTMIAEHGLDQPKLKKAEKQLLATLPEQFFQAIQCETGDLQSAGWSSPPGARFITYQRPYGIFRPQPRATRQKAKPPARITAARLVLWGKPQPRIEDAIRIGELCRIAVISRAGHLLGKDNVPPVLSGHGMERNDRHGHAFYLPEDADRDGRIDHILIYAEDGLSGAPLRALGELTRLWMEDGKEWQITLEQFGSIEQLAGSPYLGRAREWRSVTPYLHPWFRKKRLTVVDQIRRECRERGLPEPAVDILDTPYEGMDHRRRRPVHFHRFRNTRKRIPQPDTRGQFVQLTFPEPIAGPLALGFGCHFGLGSFTPEGRVEHAGPRQQHSQIWQDVP